MNTTPDYSQYSLAQLQDAYNQIDKELYPEQAAELAHMISELTKPQLVENNRNKNTVISQSRIKFHGQGTEFFAIWIVNLLLTIVTLGIYSAWATVRTNRYFYSNTEIDGHRLSYLAQPLQILKGRIIAFLLFAAYYVLATFYPSAGAIFLIVLFLLTPFIICLGVRFRMRMMAYRHVRFDFTIRYGRACVVFIVFPILAVFSFYLALPWALKKIDEFLYENMDYGDKKFITELSASAYYIAALLAITATIVGGAIVVALAFVSGVSFSVESVPAMGPSFVILTMFVYFLVFFIAHALYTAFVRNHVYNNTKIEEVARLGSDLSALDLVILNVTNYLMLVFTLGLAMPWVKVRTARLLCSATEVAILEGVNTVIADKNMQDNAVADEVIGAFDIDVSLG